MAEEKKCKHCGKPESEHCLFEAAMPAGCVCDPASWAETPGPICAEFVGDGDKYCETCEHNKECHHGD